MKNRNALIAMEDEGFLCAIHGSHSLRSTKTWENQQHRITQLSERIITETTVRPIVNGFIIRFRRPTEELLSMLITMARNFARLKQIGDSDLLVEQFHGA